MDIADSSDEVSIETILTSNGGWSNQQTTLDNRFTEHLTDQDLDAISLSEFILTTTQFKVQLFSSSTLFQNSSEFSIGEGLDFDVDSCTIPGGEKVAAKRVKLATALRRSDGSLVSDLSRRVRKVLQEIRILKHSIIERSSSIINLIGASLESVQGDFTTPLLVLEYAEFGTLRQYLSNTPHTSIQEKQELCLQVGRGLLTLHACNICHGDVKLDNVLVVRSVEGNAIAKIADFGSSILMQDTVLRYIYWGTTSYNAPELRSNENTQSGTSFSIDMLLACDVFSYGLLLYESVHDGVEYWKVQGGHKSTLQYALETRIHIQSCSAQFASSELVYFEPLRNAIEISITLDPQPRRNIRLVLEKIAGEKTVTDRDEFSAINLREEAPHNLIDLTDSVTLYTLLTGGGSYMSNHYAPKPPFEVQQVIFNAYARHALSKNRSLSALMHMQVGMCYLVGFGAGRDIEQAYHHLKEASAVEYPALRPLLTQYSQFFGMGISEKAELPPLSDTMASQVVAVLEKAVTAADFISPLHEISQIWKATAEEMPDMGSELHTASYAGREKVCDTLLQQGHRDFVSDDGYTATILACIDGSLPTVKLLLDFGSNPDLKDPDGYSVWHLLIFFPLVDVGPTAALFFEYCTDKTLIDSYSPAPYKLPEMFDKLVGTPLHWAIQTNNVFVVRELLRFGADIDTHHRGLMSPVELASSRRSLQILEILLEHAQNNSIDLSRHAPLYSMDVCHPLRLIYLHGEQLQSRTEKTVDLLTNHWKIDELNSMNWTPVLKYALIGFSPINDHLVAAMLEHAALHVEGQRYPLLIASIHGCTNNNPSNCSLPIFLIEKGLDLTHTTSGDGGRGWNSLHWASAYNNTSLISAILKKNPHLVNRPTDSPVGEYPLNIAAVQSNGTSLLTCLEVLKEAGGDPTARSKEHGLTPLGSFISEQAADFDDEAFRYILSISKENQYLAYVSESMTWNALQLATDLSASFAILGNFRPLNLLRHILLFDEVINLLEVRTTDGLTPLLLASKRADYATVRVLADAGADVTATGRRERTSLSILIEESIRPAGRLKLQFGDRWNTESFRIKWRNNAYKAAMYVAAKLRSRTDYTRVVLTNLHIAACMCHVSEVKRLVDSGEVDASVTIGTNNLVSAREMLQFFMQRAKRSGATWSAVVRAEANEIIDYLYSKEPSE